MVDAIGRKRYVPVGFAVVQGKSGEMPVRTRHCIRDVDPGSQVAWLPRPHVVGRVIPEEDPP
ncbi:hypothetical protein GCM10023194_79970 [Planotetraspora phitsanulokensis]|uniref:Uncharacterized protein n=1 Tax=Planotetraspora phitsanulokensis TaxID=575192 RepID=A0A8J3XHU5_9ACTN|nr:hypothetical protein Pph01_66770 [Planotetraspora phitsanulokensis]